MIASEQEHSIKLLHQLGKNKSAVIPLVISGLDTPKPELLSQAPNSSALIANLMKLNVTALSRFEDVVWDYNHDVLNPPKSVVGAKLKITFSKYQDIPPYILIEMKCLMHYVLTTPESFKKSSRSKKSARKSLKPNTVISQFESGLRYLNFLFGQLNKLGIEYVLDKYKSITDVLDSDFKKAAKEFSYTVDAQTHQFFNYLTHPLATEILGEQVKVDFSSISWVERKSSKRKVSFVFENDVFERNTVYSTQKILGFLMGLGEEINDKVAMSHYEHLSRNSVNHFTFNQDTFNDYVLIRLLTKGYSDEYISRFCDISREYLRDDGKLLFSENVRKIAKSKHGITHFDDLRKEVNEVYYASAYIIYQFTGMRPSEAAEIKISSCLNSDNGFDLICSNVKKGKLDNLKLFDDKWVTIPIMKDALRAAKLISVLKNNDYLLSNVDTVKPEGEAKSMGPGGIAQFFKNYFVGIYGAEKVQKIQFNPYMLRHTLTYQLYRAELGLPFISFQLKHVVDHVGRYTSFGATSDTTLGYGEIAERITRDKAHTREIRHLAEVERVKSVMDPEGNYAGPKGKEHKKRITKVFQGYLAAGYTREEIFDAMAEQGLAVINVGSGFCFGGVEDFDDSLPCIGSLRCNPIRCSNAIVTKVNAPKWREVVVTNRALLGKEGYEDRREQLLSAIKEAEGVLKLLGEEIVV